jgi:hypothetical protein
MEVTKPESDAKHPQLFSKEILEPRLHWTTQADNGLQSRSYAFYLQGSGHVFGLVSEAVSAA